MVAAGDNFVSEFSGAVLPVDQSSRYASIRTLIGRKLTVCTLGSVQLERCILDIDLEWVKGQGAVTRTGRTTGSLKLAPRNNCSSSLAAYLYASAAMLASVLVALLLWKGS